MQSRSMSFWTTGTSVDPSNLCQTIKISPEEKRYYTDKHLFKRLKQQEYYSIFPGEFNPIANDFSPKEKVKSEKRIKLDNLIAYYYLRNR